METARTHNTTSVFAPLTSPNRTRTTLLACLPLVLSGTGCKQDMNGGFEKIVAEERKEMPAAITSDQPSVIDRFKDKKADYDSAWKEIAPITNWLRKDCAKWSDFMPEAARGLAKIETFALTCQEAGEHLEDVLRVLRLTLSYFDSKHYGELK